MIELKNIDLSNITIEEQLDKCSEEYNELYKAFHENDEKGNIVTEFHVIEEFIDYFQAYIGYLERRFGITAEELMDYYNKYHIEKLKNRPRENK